MNRPELIATISERRELSEQDVAAVIDEFQTVIIERLKVNDTVRLQRFITFSTRLKKQRNGYNPYTKEPMIIPETIIPQVKLAKNLLK